MSHQPAAHAIYLDVADGPVSAVFHPARPRRARDTAVLFAPPFGWEETSSYRHLRTWAGQLAHAGYPSVRLSFPSTGDSAGGPHDPDRLEAWISALQSSVSWLREATGGCRITVVGMELGGIIAYLAAASGAPIDDLVLWATPSRGQALVRQLRAFSKLESGRFYDGLRPPPPMPPGELEAGGFVLGAQTVQQLKALDLAAVSLPAGSVSRVLLLGRDGLTVDTRLQAQLENGDRVVTVSSGDGYARMTSHPQLGRPALEVIDRVGVWLDEASAVVGSAVAGDSATRHRVSVSAEIPLAAGVAVRETHVTIEQPFGTLSGVLVESLAGAATDACVVLLNAGANRRIGPNRMYVEAARRWAACGIPTLRLDVEGIGEADGTGDDTVYASDSSFYLIDRIPQVRAALDFLRDRGVANRFVLGGLCAGAFWSLHAAIEDPRVDLVLMLNPTRVVWDPGEARALRRLLTERPSWSDIRRAAAEGRIRRLAIWMLAAPKRIVTRSRGEQPSVATQADAALAAFEASGKRMLLLFTPGEPLEDELRRSGWMSRLEQNPAVTIEHIMVRDHTMRPTWAQREAHAVLDRALGRELGVACHHISPGGLVQAAA